VKGWCEWLFAENDNMKALKVAGELSKSQPKHPLGPFLEGIAFERDGKDRKAIAAYEEALKRDANFLDAHKNLAILCHTQNPMYTDEARTKKALEHYERYFAARRQGHGARDRLQAVQRLLRGVHGRREEEVVIRRTRRCSAIRR
jgi:tetratricopeptide (TPR) repeat protein